ncbi:SDR family oxidoreductase [Paenibacillus kribbensis]|uniref:SDR family oxidoreductase n=1 Tax=Paenibacillus kribbensis TaxID=172713 RepID=UPI002DBE34D5|nr:SDR family oxidoreductase [Paenibacillus kribbensis]MEC0236105.1 SDR family oxidoreductase [Paenibacillus kribbensis]
MKTWFITGTSRGFGRIMTEKLLQRGDRVAATVRQQHALDDLKQQYGEQLWVSTLDVTDVSAIREVVNQAFEALGRIDVIVNNAGYSLFGAVEEVSDEQIAHQFNTNFMGSLQVARAAIPHLRAQGGGRIMQLSSMAGQVAMPAVSMYHASKWAVEGFFEALVQEVAPFNIQGTLVEPGGARTSFGSEGMVAADAMSEYEGTPVGYMRSLISGYGGDSIPGDPVKMVEAMIEAVDQETAPLRLTLGSDAYKAIHKSLTARLASLEQQKSVAYSTDFETTEA